MLGLKIVGSGKTSTYIRHPNTPWYIVILPRRHRDYLSPVNRFTLKVTSAEEVANAHKEFSTSGKQKGVTELWDLQENGRVSFIFADLNRNWWEVTS